MGNGIKNWFGACLRRLGRDTPLGSFFPRNTCVLKLLLGYNLKTHNPHLWQNGRNNGNFSYTSRHHNKYYHHDDHNYADGTMRSLAAALYGDIMPVAERLNVMKRLEKEILVHQKGHIDVGITGGAMLFKVLREEGRDDLIFSMTSQTTYPGWGYMRENGATTIWEMWEKDLPGHSLLHSSYLYPGAWYVDGVAGIRQDIGTPGYRNFHIRIPRLTESQVSWARADFDSPAGLIRSSWKRTKGRLTLKVTVPPNCHATVWFPDEAGKKVKEDSGLSRRKDKKKGYILFEIDAGTYQFSN